MSNNSNSHFGFFTTALISGSCAAAANFLANVAWRGDQSRNLDWRDLALLTSMGAAIGVRYAKTGRPFFSF